MSRLHHLIELHFVNINIKTLYGVICIIILTATPDLVFEQLVLTKQDEVYSLMTTD